MAYILDNFAISGEGFTTFANNPIESLAFSADTLGFDTTTYGADTPFRVVRLGWLAFGNQYDPDDGTVREWYSQIQWLDFANQFVFAPGRKNTAAGVGNYYDRVRWQLEPLATAHIWVNTF